MNSMDETALSRRSRLPGGAAAATCSNVTSGNPKSQAILQPHRAKVSMSVDGKRHATKADTSTTLLDALREHTHLTATKKRYDHRRSGASDVILSGMPINAGLTWAVMHNDDGIITIDATIETVNAQGTTRTIPIADFHRQWDNPPHFDASLRPDVLMNAVIRPGPIGGTHDYRKVCDRKSYAYALVHVAALIQRDGSGQVAVGPKSWRIQEAYALRQRGTRALAGQLMADPGPRTDNAFKGPLVERKFAAVIAEAQASKGTA